MRRERIVSLVGELYDLIDAVPFPLDGRSGKTPSVKGFTGYSEDMRYFIPTVKRILISIIAEINNVDVEDYGDPLENIKDLKEWVYDRRKAGWE